jgi:outer membrane protein assembly factor BamE (lipoprotein component of BamABCDE complex)
MGGKIVIKRMILTGLISSFLWGLPVQAQPTTVNPYSLLQYSQLKIGMTYDQVKAILGSEGQGDRFRNNQQPNSPVIYHWINGNGSAISIVFDSDKKVINLASYNLGNPEHLQVTKTEEGILENLSQSTILIDQYNQIKLGMAYDEVVKIMGSEGKKDGEINQTSRNLVDNRYHWVNPNGSEITVIFDQNQKVTSVLTQNLDNYKIGQLAPPNHPDGPTLATREQYYQLRLGMTYEAVKTVMGSEGTLNTGFNPELAENFKAAYEWMNPDGTGIKVIMSAEDQVLSIYSYGMGVGLRYQ